MILDLLGRPYRLGADGTDPDGAIDCIHLVYKVREELGLPSPPLQPAWYSANKTTVLRVLLMWGTRVPSPVYDGTVALLPDNSWVFGVVWTQGVLAIHSLTKRVTWTPLDAVRQAHYFWQKA